MSEFFRELDRRLAEASTQRILANRPENLHDYQGCKADEEAKTMTEKDMQTTGQKWFEECNCQRDMPYLDWSHDKTCPLYRPFVENTPKEDMQTIPDDLKADYHNAYLWENGSYIKKLIGRIASLTTALEEKRKDNDLLNDALNEIGSKEFSNSGYNLPQMIRLVAELAILKATLEAKEKELQTANDRVKALEEFVEEYTGQTLEEIGAGIYDALESVADDVLKDMARSPEKPHEPV